MALTPDIAAQELLNRRAARSSFVAWCRLCGFEPAEHHLYIINELQMAVDNYKKGISTNLMIMMPPGSAKSTYTSKCFPAWFLAQTPNLAVLACSHSAELATDFGRAGRNLVDTHHKILGYELSKDSRAADSWEVTNGGYYRAAGCGAGIAGRRADLGLIDDFVGTEEEAGSKTFNDKIWNWWLNDFIPRLKPGAIRIVICNHRNEDDLVGRLMAREGSKWKIIRLRLLIETEEQAAEDPLKRSVGQHLWPTYFTAEMVAERMLNPKSSGIEQQDPSPIKGSFFQAEWIDQNTYASTKEFEGGQMYAASDHAVSEAQAADPSCLGLGVWKNGYLYIHPDLVWKRIGTKEAVESMLRMGKEHKPLYWWAEKGHISKSLLPFLQDRMVDTHTFFNIQQVTPTKDKVTRAQSINGLMSMNKVLFPSFAPWFQRARKEMLVFPNGSHDDFVDFIALLGAGVNRMCSSLPRTETKSIAPDGLCITPRSIKDAAKREKRAAHMASLA